MLSIARQDCTAKGLRDYAILILLARYGVWVGEIAGLRLEDLDWRKKIIRYGTVRPGAFDLLAKKSKLIENTTYRERVRGL